MKQKNFSIFKLLPMIFFICLQIVLNLYSTIVGNDAHPRGQGLMDQEPTPDNAYWHDHHELFYETLQLPVAVHPVILDYFPLVPKNVQEDILQMIKTCEDNGLSKPDFDNVQMQFVKMLVEWKYNHNIGQLNEGVSFARSFLQSVLESRSSSSVQAKYQTLYQHFLNRPIPGVKREDLRAPRKLKKHADLLLAIKHLPIWCRLKANVLLHNIEHFPKKWHKYSYRRLRKAIQSYYTNKKTIENNCESIAQKCVCLRESEELLATTLTAEVIEYTSYFENNHPWFKEAEIMPRLSLQLEKFTYPDILVFAQSLPLHVHDPLKVLYENFSVKRRTNAEEISNMQKTLLAVLLLYVNEENEGTVAETLTSLINTSEQLEGPSPAPSLVNQRSSASERSPVRERTAESVPSHPDAFGERDPPSILGNSSEYIEQSLEGFGESIEQNLEGLGESIEQSFEGLSESIEQNMENLGAYIEERFGRHNYEQYAEYENYGDDEHDEHDGNDEDDEKKDSVNDQDDYTAEEGSRAQDSGKDVYITEQTRGPVSTTTIYSDGTEVIEGPVFTETIYPGGMQIIKGPDSTETIYPGGMRIIKGPVSTETIYPGGMRIIKGPVSTETIYPNASTSTSSGQGACNVFLGDLFRGGLFNRDRGRERRR